ncbi:MAG TPA: 1-deoxy-D-xylulose-5-phosphate synthase N-terminal domain-containing protein [Candidatus Sulfopaludibacter sp.]|jgi:transketolase|nr:1-deoxy-D-xylulose-5-phosphate synthase N-terminal domain-containing protein [Candidatus Sulfopaludibacter sp.]
MSSILASRFDLSELAANRPERFQYNAEGGAYLNLRGLDLDPIPEIDEPRIAHLCRIVRGFSFAAVDAAQSGHPGGSSSKTEMVMSLLLSGALAFDAWNPKASGRSRVVWSAGHCTPLFHSTLSLVYETLRRKGFSLGPLAKAAVYPEQLANFRRWGGPSGHVESNYALADTSTGSSGHGFSAGLGFGLLHRSCGLDTKVFVIAGDAETEEGMSYEARNVAASLGVENLVVTLDYNHFGIDGPITEAMPVPYLNHWFAHGWNVIEVDGHNVRELVHAYGLAGNGVGPGRPTVVICHTTKGIGYGRLEGTADSHGTPLKHDEYVEAVHGLGFDIPGKSGDCAADLRVIASALRPGDVDYLQERLRAAARLIAPERVLIEKMRAALPGRPMADYTTMHRPETLPPELVFREGDSVPTRKATEAWFAWAMKNTAFFYVGAGDLMKSILTGKAESVYGVMSPENRLGRGIRFGIAEQNMAMLSCAMAQDSLPGGFRPMSAFATYGVFTPMMANSVRMTLINTSVNPDARAFFIMLAAHDGPETGEDGPTHHGLFWMSLFAAYPGIKVYKPLDANEAVEMLFHAARAGEPIVFSAVRPGTPVLARGNGVPPAREAVNGAYVFKPFREDGKPKKVLVVAGGQVMANVLEVLPQLEERADVKIVAVTSPQLYEQLRRRDPRKAEAIFSEADRQIAITLHNGWGGFLYPFLLPDDYRVRTLAMDDFSRSGKPGEIYKDAHFDAASLLERLTKAV